MKSFMNTGLVKNSAQSSLPTATVIPAQAGIHFYNKSKASDFRVKQGMSPSPQPSPACRRGGKNRRIRMVCF
jgi:hypothetical protein